MKTLTFALENGDLPARLGVVGYEGDAGCVTLEFTGAQPGVTYALDLEHQQTGAKNVLALENQNGTLSVELDDTVCIPAGRYDVQLRTVGQTVTHSALSELTVRDAINAVDSFDPVPSEMRQLEEQIRASAEEIRDLEVEAVSAPAGADAAVTRTGGDGTPYRLTFTIPKGDQGEPGQTPVEAAPGSCFWTSKMTVDALCVPFTCSGSTVTCHPVPGYPLDVRTEAAQVSVCGKNFLPDSFFDFSAWTNGGYYLVYKLNLPAGKYVLWSDRSAAPAGTTQFQLLATLNGTLGYYPLNASGQTITVGEGDHLRFNVRIGTNTAADFARLMATVRSVQVERNVKTTYEPYRGSTVAVTDGAAVLPAVTGENFIYSHAGTGYCRSTPLSVSGAEDPHYTVQTLKQAIVSLGGNV